MIFTYAEKLAEAKREVALRRNVYPGFVARKKMRQSEADRHLALMEAIVADYEKAIAREAQKAGA